MHLAEPTDKNLLPTEKKNLKIHLLFVCEVKVAGEKREQFPLTTTSFQR